MARGQDRIKEYQALSPRIKAEFVDPIKSPAKAQAYDVRGPWPILVVELGDKRERVTNDSEQDITNALIKVTRDSKKTVCLLEGEGERSGEDSGERGMTGAKSSLTKALYEVKNVFLMREKTVPKDCTVLIVAGPEKDLLPETTAAIKDYVKQGGKALVSVLSGGLLSMQEANVANGGGEIEVKVGDSWGPGAYVTAILYRPMEESLKRMPSRAIQCFWLAIISRSGTAPRIR